MRDDIRQGATGRLELVVFENDEREETSADEQKKHECVWLGEEDLAGFRLPEGHRFLLNSI